MKTVLRFIRPYKWLCFFTLIVMFLDVAGGLLIPTITADMINAGINGGPAGDLHVYISVRPHTIFERRGDDIWCEMPLTFTQAALGAEVTVPTLDGKVAYTVHEGTQPGDVFKLKGKGVPHLNGRGRGDQFVRVTIEVPKNLSARQKEILREFDQQAEEKNYQKRKGFFDKIKDLFGE